MRTPFVCMNQQWTLRDLAAYLGLQLKTLFWMKSGLDSVVIPFTRVLKPAMTDIHHKVGCVLYSVSKLDPVDLYYKDIDNSIHLDKKWLFVSERWYCVRTLQQLMKLFRIKPPRTKTI